MNSSENLVLERLTEKYKDVLNEDSEAVGERIDKNEVIKVLSKRFAEECQAGYMYWIAKDFLVGRKRAEVEETFEEHAKDEIEDHGNKLLKRISELGGSCYLFRNPNLWESLSTCKYYEPNDISVKAVLKQNIEAEKCAIKGYLELIDMVHQKDYTTEQMAKEILADEETHLQDLQDYLADIDSDDLDDVQDYSRKLRVPNLDDYVDENPDSDEELETYTDGHILSKEELTARYPNI